MKLIELINVSKSYLNKTFNLCIKNNEKIIITGQNGSGKSTLIKLISKYIKPSKGIIINNLKEISYLEEIISLPLNMKVNEYIISLNEIKNVSFNYELYNILKFPLNKYIYQLSKGNKQKLAIYNTLVTNSKLIILDEALNGLDTLTKTELLKYIEKLNKTIIIVTHYPLDYKNIISKEIKL